MGNHLGSDGTSTDEALFSAYVRGDERAFEALYGRYSSRLYSFLRVRLGIKRGHLVDELFQKTWLKIHLARQTFDPGQRFASWFYTVALNSLRDELGSKAEASVHEELSEELVSSEGAAEERQIRKDLIERIASFLPELPVNQRTALLLSDLEEMSSQEISQAMRISDAAARKLVSRARIAIRQRFAKEDER